jgi:hypothetical protein
MTSSARIITPQRTEFMSRNKMRENPSIATTVVNALGLVTRNV